jgi:hypothetical protein
MLGNERDCICDKPKGKHKKYCDAYRLAEFKKKCAAVNLRKDKNL